MMSYQKIQKIVYKVGFFGVKYCMCMNSWDFYYFLFFVEEFIFMYFFIFYEIYIILYFNY